MGSCPGPPWLWWETHGWNRHAAHPSPARNPRHTSPPVPRRPDDPSGRMGERPTGRLACSWPHTSSSTCLQLSRGSGLLPTDVLVAWLAGPLSLLTKHAVARPDPPQISCAFDDPNASRARRLLVIVFAKEKDRHEIRALEVTMIVASLPTVVGRAIGYWPCTRRPPVGDHRPVPSGLCLFFSRVISSYRRCTDVPAAIAVLADNSTHPQGGHHRAKLLQKRRPTAK
ncbi:hypothetical protein F4679DRAFT_564030 [Xylaria curta]|nr:hypothetical protein F4679DRAFT_564030 [Xylaria curta]